ncbi:hypothetical protein MLD38_016976 [Melastoma candidum]|uniref:Uncharacterized protein n=1 Tax=Melastoma candidum TaxID=119954 RepID=A0ACB9QT64_9MYRT|nr:hypothetical protein MLD38_016976 [Melastoma candidum]
MVDSDSFKQKQNTGTRIFIKSGLQTRFWEDDWLICGELKDKIIRSLNKLEKEKTLASYYIDKTWQRHGATTLLPDAIWAQINNTILSHDKNRIAWKFTSDGVLSTASAYNLTHTDITAFVETNFTWIWKLPILPKKKLFV